MDDKQYVTQTAMVLDIQRCCLHDGPGLRTTVFLKGCPLRCLWCHNPESIDPCPSLSYRDHLCVNCGKCVAVCPAGAHSLTNGVHCIDRNLCRACGACADQCSTDALEMVGRQMEIAEVMKIVLRDRNFYMGGGGLTVSGGEPTMQNSFTFTLLSYAKEQGIHTAVETSGFCAWEKLEKLLSVCDLFLYDLKESDNQRHERCTSRPLEPVLNNLDKLCRAGANVILRCPLVPGVNDDDEHLRYIADLTKRYTQIIGAEVMPYHNLGVHKHEQFGMQAREEQEFIIPSGQRVNEWVKTIRQNGGRVINISE